MKRQTLSRLLPVLFAALLSGAHAEEVTVTVRPVPGGTELDAGSGARTYLCVKDRITAKIPYGSKMVTLAGKYLSVMFGAKGVSFNSSERELPGLTTNEVRLSCKAGKVNAKAGADIILLGPEE